MTSILAKPTAQVTDVQSARPLEFPRLLQGQTLRVKRLVDVTVAITLALMTLPLVLLIAGALALESGGPVLFAHTRIGRHRRRFRVWKFRSMVVDADDVLDRYLADNPAAELEWQFKRKLKDDPRITRVGRILRRTSLDELPQIWNVIRGEMSIVGPRPIVEAEIPQYGSAFRLYTLVNPGLTGLWQVSGRNDTSYRRRVELDCDYIRRWTPALDILLLLKTVRVVLAGKGAY